MTVRKSIHVNRPPERTFRLFTEEIGKWWPLKEGLSMIAAGDIDDLGTRRLELALPAFRAWPVPDPDRDDWGAWQTLLGSTRAPPDEPPGAAMRFHTDGYATVSSALIALPACDGSGSIRR